MDWSQWTPQDIATLLFVIRSGEILLIRKKRGLGAGKVNGPGGRMDPGETPVETAVREVREELGVTPLEPRKTGELRFAFADGYALMCHVFASDRCEGEAIETDEAVPLWTPLDAIPYGEMWQDDALWLPKMLSGYGFDGRFVFDQDVMRSSDLTLRDPAESLFASLKSLGIVTHTRAHEPVFTVAQSQRNRPADEPGVHVKNLFVRDRREQQFLVTVREDRAVNLAQLAEQLGASKLSFGSPDRLRRVLGVEPGSVTPFAVHCDPERKVTLALDSALRESEWVHCHPLTNDRSTAIRMDDLLTFVAHTGHEPRWLTL